MTRDEIDGLLLEVDGDSDPAERDLYPGMTVYEVDIGDLIPAEYNPRDITPDERKQIKESIRRFGMVEPLIVNDHPSRRNVIIGGHQRWKVLGELGWEGVPVVYVTIGDIGRERELNLRLNKNVGHWDEELLRGFSDNELASVGFSEKEIASIFGDGDDAAEKDDPEIPFASEMLEENNYVVLQTSSRLDWLRFESFYPLPTVWSKRSRKGWEMKGTGRVVDLGEFLDRVFGEDQGDGLAGRVAAAIGVIDRIVSADDERAQTAGTDLGEIRAILAGDVALSGDPNV